jgi:hypothetical protein
MVSKPSGGKGGTVIYGGKRAINRVSKQSLRVRAGYGFLTRADISWIPILLRTGIANATQRLGFNRALLCLHIDLG